MDISRLAVSFLLLALPALAQLDSAGITREIRAPLHRETFHLPRGFDLTVDYGAKNQVCKLELPAEMPPPEGLSGAYDSKQDMQAFLLNLVPASMRGKEVTRGLHVIGGFSVSHIIYEHVTMLTTNTVGRDEIITVQFNNTNCH
jgi:hypothetical protein